METYWTTKWEITTKFTHIGTTVTIHITTVHGPHTIQKKIQFMEDLKHISSLVEKNYWIIGGYLNMITSLVEKKGGLWRLDADSKTFNQIIKDLCLIDIETTNETFT